MFGYSVVFTLLSYFKVYHQIYSVLPDTLGYSIFTSIFMWSVYANKKYCTSTKIAVIGLMVLNIANIAYILFGIDGIVYDVYLLVITLIILTFYKI